jgi:hypothetical protein
MALLSGLEILFVLLIVGILFLLTIRGRKRSLSPLPFLIIGLLLLAVLLLGKGLLAFFASTVLLTILVLVLVAVILLILTRR